ncbi:hypothetical protein Tco_1107457 [Tanacetum coccineum]
MDSNGHSCHSLGQRDDTFTRTMLLNVAQLQKQLDKDEFQEDGSMTAFWVVNNQFQKFIDSKFTLDYDSQMTDTYFVEYTGIEIRRHKSQIDYVKLWKLNLYKESIRTESTVQDDSNRSGNDTDTDDADIRPIYDEEPMAEVGFEPRQHGQILKQTSNKAKIEKEIDVTVETMETSNEEQMLVATLI